MTRNGFWISEIRIIGDGTPPAALKLVDGLNVIAGASNTGKSYILHCINYMLGAQKPPKSVKEDARYSTALLELSVRDGRRFVLQRSLKQGGDFLVYEQPLGTLAPADNGNVLRWKHDPNRDDTISSFLLGLSSLGGAVIQQKSTKTRQLSFRDICRFMLITETAIITERSPVLASGQNSKSPEDKSIFDFMVSGEDASSVINAPDIQVRKAAWKAQVELYDKMIGSVQNAPMPTEEDLKTRLAAVDAAILEVTSVVSEANTRIAKLGTDRRERWTAIHAARSRAGVVDQLLARFELLREHYQSDRERLKFLSEGEHYLAQLGAAHCPLCGSLLSEHDAEQLAEDKSKRETIQDAAAIESNKIAMQLRGLASTIEGLQTERRELESAIAIHQERLSEIEHDLQSILHPQLKVGRDELTRLLAAKNELQLFGNQRTRLEQLVRDRQDLGPEPKQQRKSAANKESTVSESRGRRAFADIVEALLRAWKYPDVGTVEFDQNMELIVNGIPRNSNGKGIRAIQHSAFTIGLMMHAAERHPGLTVLDSPLTSFKEKDEYEVDEDIQRGFFEHLAAQTSLGQVIVLENKDPPADLQSSMQYEHFSGRTGTGRQGFYPR